MNRKEPKWVRNSELFNEEIDKTGKSSKKKQTFSIIELAGIGQTGMINKAFDDKIEELTIPK